MITPIRHWARGMTQQDNKAIKKWLGQFVDDAVPTFGSVVFKFHRGELSAVETRQSVQVKVEKPNSELAEKNNPKTVNKTEE